MSAAAATGDVRLARRVRTPEAVRRERRDVEEPHEALGPPERDLLDSPSDSWRDLELRAMLDEIGAA